MGGIAGKVQSQEKKGNPIKRGKGNGMAYLQRNSRLPRLSSFPDEKGTEMKGDGQAEERKRGETRTRRGEDAP